MAASAYAALASLYNVLEQIQHPIRHRLFDTSQIETLREMVSFLLDLFADYSKVVYDSDVQDIVRLITNCSQEAEDSIDSHIVDHLTQRSADKAHIGNSSFCEDIDRVIQKMKHIKKAMVEFTEEESSSQTQQRPSVSMPTPYGKKTMVGFDDHLTQIMDRLKGDESGLQIVPIVGMGGIGKTTLAQNAFHDPCFKDHFDIRIWFTISQEYSVQDILSGLLHGKGGLGHDKKNKESNAHDIAELGKELYQKLFGQTYLIVLDDVWSTNVWDDLKFYFPDNQKGSRIIVTTRLSSVADSLGGHNSYSVGFLDDEKSWELFCGVVFGKKGCHDPELEKIGKDIAKDCKGLPLAIVVIGGLLSKSNMTQEYWEEVAKNVNSIANSNDNLIFG